MKVFNVRRPFPGPTAGFLLAVGLLTGGAFVGTVTWAQGPDPKAQAKEEKKLVQGEREARKMILLMDTNKNGKISKQEYMKFMEEEFDRLDVNKDGELDVRELTQSQLQVHAHSR